MPGRPSDDVKFWSASPVKLFDRKLRRAEQTLMTGMDTFTSESGPPKRDDDDTMMKHVTLCMVFAIAMHSLCCADVTKLSAEVRKVLQDSSRFHEVHLTNDLPSAIVALCGDKLAEPGGNWNVTDAISDPTLPAKRLIWAATGGDYYIVHYERGGIAHTFHVLVAKLVKNEAKPKVVWQAIGGPFKDYAAFLDALRNGKLDDRLDWH